MCTMQEAASSTLLMAVLNHCVLNMYQELTTYQGPRCPESQRLSPRRGQLWDLGCCSQDYGFEVEVKSNGSGIIQVSVQILALSPEL